MNSMTGYGSSQIKSRQLEVEIHVKSVNGRFLELRFHLPKEYAPFENDFRKLFAGWSRGTIDIYVHRRPAPESKIKTVHIRQDNARYWAKTLRSLGKSLGVAQDVRLRDILAMPFVVEHQDRSNLQSGELKLVESALKKAIEGCETARALEGKALRRELLKQLKFLETQVEYMVEWREEAQKSSHQRLKSKMSTIDSSGIDASRLALETALLIDKMDVHEEIVRLREHIKACRGLIQDSESRGKKLDFYCQELLREVNTIGSKSQLASLTQVVVGAKSTIEKFREQVQNAE